MKKGEKKENLIRRMLKEISTQLEQADITFTN